ncbi:NAD-dependent epimerase/dehydratase family protein [Aliikangiella marina]|uniref:NAD-dependent epimerase/dehydratase family protein n=1 Tax=Aliikangiella marina TaxID=1712262 RepID=A0A545T530_9GAMM|nr:saccharopine dehydrogenase NADP-binding domain-containing protein [Aliikangiella marina]TQV72313.1 NAD-dependent epimerase/dehydratase family protein [Aliikangiella marina]
MHSQDKLIMIYGANGYTGRLIVDHALEKGLKPIVAGRNKEQVKQIAEEKGLPARVFDLDSVEQVANNLNDIAVVIHCAGPFSATAKPMMEACIKSKTHYTDITGEIVVFELGQSYDAQAKEAGVVICPGVGFDVIPTDCLASQLKDKLPDATHLKLGFDSGSSMSPGTAKTSVEGLAQGGKIRENGKIIQVPLAFKTKTIDFGNGEKNAMTIPWGDVSTAYYSTGIPNIEVYIPISPKGAKKIKRLNAFKWLLGTKLVQNFLKKQAGKSRGPNEQQREKLKTYVWGEVRNDKGAWVTGHFETANGYELTYLGAVAVAEHLLANEIEGGAFTPSKLVDNKLVERLPGTGEIHFKPE